MQDPYREPMSEIAAQQEVSELYITLVNRVDALTRAAMELALVRRDLATVKANREYEAIKAATKSNYQKAVERINQRKLKLIEDIQNEIESQLTSEQRFHDGTLESFDNSRLESIKKAEDEHSKFVAQVSENCAKYIEGLSALNKEQLESALSSFRSELGQWLYPQETK